MESKFKQKGDMDQRHNSHLTGGESEDYLFERFIRQSDKAAFELLYQRLTPGLLELLKKDFSSLDAATHQDIVQNVFLKLFKTPKKFFKHPSGQHPRAFSCLARVVQNQARDILRRGRKFPEISLDESLTSEIVEDGEPKNRLDELDQKHAALTSPHVPSSAEMEKLLRESGHLTQKDAPLLEDLKNPEFWPDDEAKPNYEELAKRHGTTVGNIQQRVSRFRKGVIQRHGGKLGFLASSSRVLASVRQLVNKSIVEKPIFAIAAASIIIFLLFIWNNHERTSGKLPVQNIRSKLRQPVSQLAPNAAQLESALNSPQNISKPIPPLTGGAGSNAGVVIKESGADNIIKGVPAEVVVFYVKGKLEESRKEKISRALSQYIKTYSLNEISSENLPIATIKYHMHGGEEAHQCASFVKQLLENAEAGAQGEYRIIIDASGTELEQDGPPQTSEQARLLQESLRVITVSLP